jgi:hypothetical protein
MNRRRTVLLSVVSLGLVGGVVFLCWPKKSDRTLRLKIVRRTLEQAQPVVFFRLEGAEGRRLQVVWIAKFIGEWPARSLEQPETSTNFWAPSQQALPVMNLISERKEFGVVVPATAGIWRMQLMVLLEHPTWRRLRQMPNAWRYFSRNGTSFLKAAGTAWNGFYQDSGKNVFSDPITNSVPP